MRTINGMIRILGLADATEAQRQQAAEQLVLAAIEAEVDYRLYEEDTRIGYPSISPTATLGGVGGGGGGGYDALEWECEHMAQRSHVAMLGQQLLADLPSRALAAVMLTAYPTTAPKGVIDSDRQARAPREVTLAWVVENQFSMFERLGLSAGWRMEYRWAENEEEASKLKEEGWRSVPKKKRKLEEDQAPKLSMQHCRVIVPFAAFPTDLALKKAASRVRQCLCDRVLMIFSVKEDMAA